QHEDHPELLPDRLVPPEQFLHRVRHRVRRDVVVPRLAAQQPVADAAAGEIRLEPRFAKGFHDGQRGVAGGHAVFIAGTLRRITNPATSCRTSDAIATRYW